LEECADCHHLEHLAQFVGKAHVGSVDEAAGDTHGPSVFAFIDGGVATALFE
jgi:hypothetical protein